MNKLDEKMKVMLAEQLPVQATVSKDGIPDIGPKRSLRYYTEDSLIYNENTGGQTLQNIKDGSKIAVAVIDRAALDGYRFLGQPYIHEEGSKAYSDALKFAEENGMKIPKFAVVVKIEQIFTLRSGPEAGKKL